MHPVLHATFTQERYFVSAKEMHRAEDDVKHVASLMHDFGEFPSSNWAVNAALLGETCCMVASIASCRHATSLLLLSIFT